MFVQDMEEVEERPQAVTSLNPIGHLERNAAFEFSQARPPF